MREVFEQYGSAMITVACVAAMIAITSVLLTNADTGIVYKAFSDLLTNFFSTGMK